MTPKYLFSWHIATGESLITIFTQTFRLLMELVKKNQFWILKVHSTVHSAYATRVLKTQNFTENCMTSLALMTQGNFAGFERQFLLQLHLKNLKFQIVLSLFGDNQIHITCCLLCAKLYANEPNNDLSKLTPFHVLKSNFRKRTCTLKHLFPHPNCLMMVFCFSHKISIN